MNDVEYVESIIRPLLNNPEALTVERITDEMGVLVSVSVASNDMGVVIGKKGNTAAAIRTILHCYGMKNKSRLSLKINEPDA